MDKETEAQRGTWNSNSGNLPPGPSSQPPLYTPVPHSRFHVHLLLPSHPQISYDPPPFSPMNSEQWEIGLGGWVCAMDRTELLVFPTFFKKKNSDLGLWPTRVGSDSVETKTNRLKTFRWAVSHLSSVRGGTYQLITSRPWIHLAHFPPRFKVCHTHIYSLQTPKIGALVITSE